MNAIILDTETNDLNGYPIEIAYASCAFNSGELNFDQANLFNQFYSCPAPISFGAMATHHILESDIANKPSYEIFRLPENTTYLIGHNIDYDLNVIKHCDKSIKVKTICTLALARFTWPELDTHSLSALFYFVSSDKEKARDYLRKAHSAKYDIWFTYIVLKNICLKMGFKDMNSLFLMSEQARIPKIINFGKHKGTALKDLDSGYVAWLLKQPDLDKYLRKALEGL